ncbi:MAG: hypothetical protein PHW91_12685 [Bacteroidales bacterium]|nr:hypothetical protein [Bacteroidales bacterium]
MKRTMKPKNFICIRILLSIGLIILSVSNIRAQNPVGKLTIQGGAIQFYVISLNHYNDGVSLSNWTRLKIKYTSITENYPFDWRLSIKSLETHLMADDPENPDLPLSNLVLVDENVVENSNTTHTVNTSFELSNTYETFISGTATGDFEVNFGITYELGKNTPLINKSWGYYYTILDFELWCSHTP